MTTAPGQVALFAALHLGTGVDQQRAAADRLDGLLRSQSVQPGTGLFEQGVDAGAHHVSEHHQIMPIRSGPGAANGPAVTRRRPNSPGRDGGRPGAVSRTGQRRPTAAADPA